MYVGWATYDRLYPLGVGRLAEEPNILLIIGMDSHTDSRNISRLEIIDTGRRRRWSNEAKLRIVEDLRLASGTARRHGMSNPLLFAWRKAYREGRASQSDLCRR